MFMLVQNLSLCTAALLYMLSRDRLIMDLDKASLELMLGLLDSDPNHQTNGNADNNEYQKLQLKIKDTCDKASNGSTVNHLNIDDITVSDNISTIRILWY